MKNAIKIITISLILLSLPLYAQDIQEIYEEAKALLLEGDYESALTKISMAQLMIEKDPNLDPNGNFQNKLLPKVEQVAENMAAIVQALEELNKNSQAQLSFPDLPASRESVDTYTQMAKNAGSSMLEKRDSILALYDLEAQYREALRKVAVYQQIDQFVSQGIVEQLSQKFVAIANVLTDSLSSLNQQFKTVSTNLENMKKSATAGKVEREKLEKELAQISQERLNYMNTISEMLIGEASPESPELRAQFIENNVESIFSDVIRSEINRLQGLTEIDSATHKEIMKNYERIKNYNQIFLKNNISADQSALLAQYEQAIQNIKVEQPAKFNVLLIVSIIVVVLILLFLILRFSRPRKTTATEQPPSTAPPAEKKD